jgi:hypothetical protein
MPAGDFRGPALNLRPKPERIGDESLTGVISRFVHYQML